MSPEELRTAQIQRQHSQEMALRLLAIFVANDSEKQNLESLMAVAVSLTDDFERDIGNAVAIREAKPEDNGSIYIDAARLTELQMKIMQTPEEARPMIKAKMQSLGYTKVGNLQTVLKTFTDKDADELQDYLLTLDF